MIQNITALGYGLVVFAIIIGVGSIVIYNFAGSTGCTTLYPYWNMTNNLCYNVTNTAGSGQQYNISPTGTAYSNSNYMLGQLGQSGLAGWTPAIIAVSVGVLFLGMFMLGRKNRF